MLSLGCLFCGSWEEAKKMDVAVKFMVPEGIEGLTCVNHHRKSMIRDPLL